MKLLRSFLSQRRLLQQTFDVALSLLNPFIMPRLHLTSCNRKKNSRKLRYLLSCVHSFAFKPFHGGHKTRLALIFLLCWANHMIRSSFHQQIMQCTPFPSCILDDFLRSKQQISLHLPPQEETLNSAVAAGSEALSGALETVNRLLNSILSPACSVDYNQFTSDLQNMSLTNPRTRYAIQSKSCCLQILKYQNFDIQIFCLKNVSIFSDCQSSGK